MITAFAHSLFTLPTFGTLGTFNDYFFSFERL
jgi:hypothetical protein